MHFLCLQNIEYRFVSLFFHLTWIPVIIKLFLFCFLFLLNFLLKYFNYNNESCTLTVFSMYQYYLSLFCSIFYSLLQTAKCFIDIHLEDLYEEYFQRLTSQVNRTKREINIKCKMNWLREFNLVFHVQSMHLVPRAKKKKQLQFGICICPRPRMNFCYFHSFFCK